MKITELLEQPLVPPVLYHAVRVDNLASIRQNGIVPGWVSNFAESDPRFVYLADTAQRALGWVPARPADKIALAINTTLLDPTKLAPDPYMEQMDPHHGHFFTYAGIIPPSAISPGQNMNITEMTDPVEPYLAQIKTLVFRPVDRKTWRIIQDEGLDQEQNAPDQRQWQMAQLAILPDDVAGLRSLTDEALEKFNLFDIRLKQLYGGRMTDLVDYEAGTVCLVMSAVGS